MKTLKSILLILFLTTSLFSQQLGTWKNYSSLKSIKDGYVTSAGLWAACQGGSFYYNFSDGTYSIFNKSEGLSNNQLTAIAVDKKGKVWMGSESGLIDVYDPSTGAFKRILDLYNSPKVSKRVNDISVSGDTVFVASDLGLSLLNAETYAFFESCFKFGDLQSESKVITALNSGLIYAATSSGIAVQKSAGGNFSAPDSWKSYSLQNLFSVTSINRIVKYRDTILAATDKGILAYNGTIWLFKAPFISTKIYDLKVSGDTLYVMSDTNKVTVYTGGKTSTPFASNSYIKFMKSGGNTLYTITQQGIKNLAESFNNSYFIPNGPKANTFSDIAIDKSGNVIVASGRDGVNMGYYRFDGNQWYNYDLNNNPALKNNAIFKVYISPDNTMYLQTWGNGFIRVRNNDTTVFNYDNTELRGLPKNLRFIVIYGLKTDAKGDVWVVNHYSATRQPISKLAADGTWSYLTNPYDSQIMTARELVIDNNDTKWFTIASTESNFGQYLYYYNEKPLSNSDVNGWGKITSSDGLNATYINCLATGRRGELWIGTSEGVFVMEDPSRPHDSKSIDQIQLFKGYKINTITVDALNQKWVGTDKGVFLVSSDGSALIANYTSENSAIASNSITSIAIDNARGIVYIGTDNGLASVTTNSVNPQENLSGMYAYPNPYYLDKNVPALINIKGLVRDSEIKVFTVSGKLVANFVSPGGGIASWDGKDMSGNSVSTGVYLIVAYDHDGSNIGTAKVAVIKK
ncbi:MAG: two-component regulator propeller domain-containing protein [Syntrophothermus sp.]